MEILGELAMYEYDVALSFAGEDRKYVKDIAKKLRAKGLKVFYDEFEEADLWGKDLYQYLHYIYKESAIFCIIFVSSNYIKKAWTRHELQAAQNRAFLENNEYILPLRLEPNTKLPGLTDTTGYIDAEGRTINQIVKLICEKVYTIKPTREEELIRTIKIYNLVFETFDFIVLHYCCFGRGSKYAEITLLTELIKIYKDFLLEHSHEINADLYIFLVQLLKEIETYMDNNELINFYHSADLKYRANVLRELRKVFEKNDFSEKFDFWYYIYHNDKLNDRDGLLNDAIRDIVEDIKVLIEHPVSFSDYLTKIANLSLFDEYLDGATNEILIQKLYTDELRDLEKWFNESDTVTFDEDTDDLDDSECER